MSRILIAGGSLGGLMAANLLVRAGHDVQVIEKSPSSLEGRGAGIVSHEVLIRGLQRCGVATDLPLGIAVKGRTTLGPNNEVLGEAAMPQLLTSWSRLYQVLRHALIQAAPEALRSGVALHSVLEVGDPVRADQPVHVQTSAGQEQADLLIGADGIRSTVRSQLWPRVQPQYAGYVAWRGVCEESWLSERTRALIFERFGFGLPEGEQFLGYPVAGPAGDTEPGRRAWNFVWYRPAPAPHRLREMLTDDDGIEHPAGIPPHRVSWRLLADARNEATRLLAPAFAEIVQKCPQPFLQAIYDLCSSDIQRGRVVLMGDAAFVARPHVGMGVTKALEDAVALADMLGAGVSEQALSRYVQARTEAGRRTVMRARWLGAYMQASAAGHRASTPRSPESVMRETAIDLELFASAFGEDELQRIEQADTERQTRAHEASPH